jgi:predicted transcriptional regulator
MDFRQLELFLAVIDQSSVTKAAARMSLSTSAVSLQLRNLAKGMVRQERQAAAPHTCGAATRRACQIAAAACRSDRA